MSKPYAFLVIDMQNGSFTSETPRLDAGHVCMRINTFAAASRAQGRPVIWVQHDGTAQNCFLPQSQEWRLLNALYVAEGDVFLAKTANDAFYETNLSNWLRQEQIDRLYIAGCATDFCVNATVLSGLNHDKEVFVLGDAHTTADRPFANARTVIDHYNWVWADLTPTRGFVKVLTTDEALAQVQAKLTTE